jgi:hypothetical protein
MLCGAHLWHLITASNNGEFSLQLRNFDFVTQKVTQNQKMRSVFELKWEKKVFLPQAHAIGIM